MADEPTILALLIEDERKLAALTREYLEGHGVAVTVVHDGEEGLREAYAASHDVVLLDLMLPGLDGIEICRKLREHSDVPVIMITARGEEADRVLGLELGADDYLPKPFSPRELLARIRAVVRRARGRAGPRSRRVKAGGLELDGGGRRAFLDGRPLDLTGYEFEFPHPKEGVRQTIEWYREHGYL